MPAPKQTALHASVMTIAVMGKSGILITRLLSEAAYANGLAESYEPLTGLELN